MDWVGIIGGSASIIGAIVSCWQCWKAKKAKDATENARDKIFQNIQYEDFTSFLKECSKFEAFLLKASKGKDIQGKNETFVADELESFLSIFNTQISKTSGVDRNNLQKQYDALCARRKEVNSKDRDSILGVIDDVRPLSRMVSDIQMNNKLRV